MAAARGESRRLGATLVLAGLFLAATGLLALATRRGPGATPDSAVYRSAAQSLAEGRGLLDFSGEPLTVFPPLFPAAWAVGLALGDGDARTVVALNAAALFLCIALTYRAAALLSASRALGLLAAAVVALSPQTWDVFPMAWSDPLYAAVAMAFLWGLGRAPPASPRDWKRLAGAAAGCGLAFGVRYPAVALGLAHGLWIWRRAPVGASAAACRFALLALLAPSAWMARNLLVDGTLMGPRPWAAETPVEALARLGAVAGGWIAPAPVHRAVLGLLAACGAVAVATGLARRRRAWDPGGPAAHLASALAIFTAGGGAFVLVASVVIAIDPIDRRLLSPFFAPAVVLAAAAARGHLDARASRGRVRIAAALASAWIVALGGVSLAAAGERSREGRGLSAALLERSSFAASLSGLPRHEPWFSNHARLTYWLTGHRPIFETPRKRAYRSDEVPDDFPRFHRRLGDEGEGVLVWWTPPPQQMCSLEELEAGGVGVVPERELDHGLLLRVRPRRPPTAAAR